jgi:hypothetical protein
MKFEQGAPRQTSGERPASTLETLLKLTERMEVLARESSSFIQSVEKLSPKDGRSPSIKTVVEEGYNIFALGKAKMERIKKDLENLK